MKTTKQKTENGKLKSEPKILTEVNEGNEGGNGSRLFIGIDLLVPDPEQPRKFFDEEKLKELAESIKQPAGMVNDILVRKTIQPKKPLGEHDWEKTDLVSWVDSNYKCTKCQVKAVRYGMSWPPRVNAQNETCRADKGKASAEFIIIDGERRWRAAKLAGLKVVPIAIREVTDATVVQLLANQQRENLSALEEAEAYRKQVNGGKKPEVLAQELGVSRATVFSRLVLTRLTKPVREALLAGKISTSVAGLVAMVPGEETQKELLEACHDRWSGPVSFRDVQALIDKSYLRQLNDASFDVKDGALVPKAGACEVCPKRSGNMVAEFPDLAKRPNVCTDPECFRKKVRADSEQKVAEAKSGGVQVLSEKEAKGLFGKRNDGSIYTQGEFDAKYADLNDRCEPLGYDYKNHWRAALGKDAPKAVLVVDPNGELHELVPKGEALKVLKENGKLKKTTNASDSAQDERWKEERRKDQAKEKVRKQECAAITLALVSKAEALKTSDPEWLWRMVVSFASDRAGYYIMKPIEERRGWKQGHYSKASAAVAKLSKPELIGLAVEMATSWSEDEQNKAATQLKVDIKKIVAEVKEARKAKGKKTEDGGQKEEKTKGTKGTKVKPAKKKGKK